MDHLWQDLRYGARMLAKNPGFSIVAVLILALGIGANSTIFTLLNSLLLRPIVAEAPHELVAVYSRDTTRPDSYRAFSYPNYRDIRELDTAFSSLMAHDMTTVGVRDGDVTQRVFAEIVSSDYFDTFGVDPVRGRFFEPAEERPESGVPVVVVSFEHWRRTGFDPDLVGKSLEANGIPLTIVGIAPREFTGRTAIMSPQVYLPMGMHHRLLSDMFVDGSASLTDRDSHRLLLVGRLRPGVTATDAEQRLVAVASRLEEGFPRINADQAFVVRPLERLGVSTSPDSDGPFGIIAVMLMAMTGIVLLVACLNLANMLLARGAARRHELAIRAAIGGQRRRILRQLLTEALLLSLLGGLAGLLVAVWVNRLLAASFTRVIDTAGFAMDLVVHATPDLRIVAATAGFCLAGTLMFGLAPALRQSRPDLVEELKGRAAGAGRASGRGRRGHLLVIAQIALSIVLLVAAGLFVRGAVAASAVDLGFPIEGALLAELDPALIGYDPPRTRAAYRQLLERLRADPGIEAAGLGATVPFGSTSSGRRVRRAEDLPDVGPDGAEEIETVAATSNVAGEGYFAALGLSVVRGRGFTRAEADSDGEPPVVVIDELLAERLWPGQDPIGRRVGFGRERAGPEFEVVGVVATVRDDLFPAAPRPHIYTPYGRDYQTSMIVHVRTRATDEPAAAAMLETVLREIRAVDPQLPVVRLRTMRGHLRESASLWVVTVGARIFGAFGTVALLLAVVGVYAIKAYTVARRTREIGIRKAIGATRAATVRLIMREGLGVTAAGIAVGLVLAAGVARLLASALYEVNSLDPLVFVSAPLILAAASMAATWVPARRAARVAPVIALRQD